MPHSHIPIMFLTSHFMCVHIFHMVSIDVPAGVGAPPPLNTISVNIQYLEPCVRPENKASTISLAGETQ